jgi:hypothetical protein
MNCPSKVLGLGLLGGSVLSAMPYTTPFEKHLSDSQKEIWNYIQYERFTIYFASLSVAIFVTRTIPQADPWTRAVLALTLTASLYMIAPKTIHMSEHLTHEQQQLLREQYTQQQLRYYGAITLAILAVPLIC